MNMNKWVEEAIAAKEKKPIPVLTFPAIQEMGITVKELIYSSDYQAQAMKIIHDKTDMGATLAFMDLSVEAESFGSTIRYSDDEVPTVVGSIIDEDTDIDAMEIPDCHEGRCGVCIEAVRKVAAEIHDKPVIAGNIGPFSLAGRLMDVNEVMYMCYDEPELVHKVLDKVTDFLIDYTKAFKEVGADGVLMAEPLAGLLSPELTEEFSNPYVKRIVDETQDENFVVFLHNCGSSVKQTVDSIVKTGAKGFHFGNAVVMSEMMPHIPSDVICMGNVDPASQFRNGTPESVYNSTLEVLHACSKYPNFIISSGCDIPPMSPWDNINAFFKAVNDFYGEEKTTPEPAPRHVPTMTSRERFYAAIEHKPVDRVPVYPFIAGANRILVGADHHKWATDADLCSRGYIEMAKMFPEEDFIIAAIDFVVECTAWGQKIIYSGNNPGVPDYSQMVVKTISDYSKIKPVDAREAHRMILMKEVCEKLVAEFKDDKPVIAYVMGPLSTLGELRGQKQLARDIRTNPKAVKAAADNIAVTLKQFGEMLMDTGIDGIMWDTYFAAGATTTRNIWKDVEGDSMAELAQMVRDRGGINIVHSCQRDVFFDVQIETIKPEIISFFNVPDDCADYKETKAKYGDQVCLMGSVAPWNSVFGTDLEWDQECFDRIDDMSEGGGFILAPGCFYPANASFGRAKRMIDIATFTGVKEK
ncbi:MAG: uroporphyrinogen decarboxylase family protein [Coriobacteriales bacterium]